MKNPFKKKKANRFRGYNPSKEELQEEFDKLLQHRVAMRMKEELGEGASMIEFFMFREENGDRIQSEEKEKMIAELKQSGYSRAHEFGRKPGQDVVFKKIIGGKHE
jgi:hypothetical protein